jgi:nicotinamide-nucleotide amidase
MLAEVISTGDEVISGQILDTNVQWLSQRLEELGIRVLYHSATGDAMDALVQVFRQAIGRADVVVITGGLGPTAADLTREAMARATGRELFLDRQALVYIREMFARRKREMPEQNERQAWFPEGSRVIRNPNGTAPGIALEVPREGQGPCHLFALPGVPAEMVEMWPSVVAHLENLRAAGRMIRHRQIKCFGAGESQMAEQIPELLRRGRHPRVGINASKTTIILRIAAEGASEAECEAAMGPTVDTIYQTFGPLIFGEGTDELQHAVLRLLGQQRKTLATAEWGTAGLVADWLGDAPGAGRYLGGLVLPDGLAAQRLLDVPVELVAEHGGASAEVARAMAEGCRQRFGADYGLAVSQFPPLDTRSEAPPFFLALSSAEGITVKAIPFGGHPSTLKIYCAKQALNLVRLELVHRAAWVGVTSRRDT